MWSLLKFQSHTRDVVIPPLDTHSPLLLFPGMMVSSVIRVMRGFTVGVKLCLQIQGMNNYYYIRCAGSVCITLWTLV